MTNGYLYSRTVKGQKLKYFNKTIYVTQFNLYFEESKLCCKMLKIFNLT